jgi:hypothetical protein
MNVNTAHSGQGEHPQGKDLSKGSYHNEVRRKAGDYFERGTAIDFLRLEDREVML